MSDAGGAGLPSRLLWAYLTGQIAGQDGPLWQVGGHVLHGVHGDVDATREQGIVHLLGEEALVGKGARIRRTEESELPQRMLGGIGEQLQSVRAAHLAADVRQRLVQDFVACGLDDDNLNGALP